MILILMIQRDVCIYIYTNMSYKEEGWKHDKKLLVVNILI